MREQLLLNAVPFTDDSEVLSHLRGVLPSWERLPASPKVSTKPRVRVALKRGHASNFLIEYANDEDEPVFIREARLFGAKEGKIELTEPLRMTQAHGEWPRILPRRSGRLSSTTATLRPAW
jgi:hypothetical protein